MAFIKDIVRLDVASLKGLLIASWVFFILVIFSSSFSAFISSRTAAGQVDFYDKYIDKNKRMPDVEPITEEAEANKKKLAEHNAMIQNLNLGAAISFPLAFVFLILFIGLNILN